MNNLLGMFFVASVCLLMEGHNSLVENLDRENKLTLFQPVALLTAPEKAMVYLMVVLITIGLMFALASYLPQAVYVIGVTMLLSFFLIISLHDLLSMVRYQKRLSLKLLVNQQVILTVVLMLSVELSFLYWLKETTTDIQQQFLFFVLAYSALMSMVGIWLGLPEAPKGGRKFPDSWQVTMIVFLDPVISVLLTGIALQIILQLISFFQ